MSMVPKVINIFIAGGYTFLLLLTQLKDAVITSELHQKWHDAQNNNSAVERVYL